MLIILNIFKECQAKIYKGAGVRQKRDFHDKGRGGGLTPKLLDIITEEPLTKATILFPKSVNVPKPKQSELTEHYKC